MATGREKLHLKITSSLNESWEGYQIDVQLIFSSLNEIRTQDHEVSLPTFGRGQVQNTQHILYL